MRILVADDDRQLSTLLCEVLRSGGHTAVPAFDGASTMMAAMRSPAPDLIVLDLQMPAGDGHATLSKLKQSSKTTAIPVLVLTATADPAARERVRKHGAAAFLQKPVDPAAFLDAVKAFGPKK